MGQNITIKLAGKEFPFEVQPSEEERIRAAAVYVNEKIEAMQYDYRGVEDGEILRVAMLDMALDRLSSEADGNERMSDLVGSLEELDSGLKAYLSSR